MAETPGMMGTSAPASQPAAGGQVTQPQAGSLPGWRDGQHHQWSRDPGRGRRHR
jgi:hypothetical protein